MTHIDDESTPGHSDASAEAGAIATTEVTATVETSLPADSAPEAPVTPAFDPHAMQAPRKRRFTARQRGWLVLAFALLAPFLFLSDFLLFEKVFYYFDFEVQWVPFHQFVHNARELGQSPLWNPFIMLGFPQHAEAQAGIFYPINLLLSSLSNQPYAIALTVYLHLVIGLAATYGLARECRLGRLASAHAAVCFAFSGFLFAQLTNYNITLVAVYLPLKFFLITRYFTRDDARYLLLLALATGIELLVSHANMSFITGVASALYFFLQACLRGRRLARDLVCYALFSLLTLLLAAIQLLPTQEFVAFSDRATGISYEGVTSYSHAFSHYLTAFFPLLFGAISSGYDSGSSFEEVYFFVGSCGILLAMAGCLWLLARRDNRHVALIALTALCGFLLSLGANNPFFDLWHGLIHVPGFNLFRAPARWAIVPTLGLAILSGYGLQQLITALRAGKRWQSAAMLTLPALTMPPLLYWLGWHDKDVKHEVIVSNLLTPRTGDLGQLDWLGRLSYEALTAISPLSYFAGVLTLVVLMVLFAHRHRAVHCAALIAAIGLIDLLAVVRPLNARMPSDFYASHGEHIPQLQREAGHYRAMSQEEFPNLQGVNNSMGAYFGIQSPHGYSALRLNNYIALTDAFDRSEIRDYIGVKYEIVGAGENIYAIAERPGVFPRAFLLSRHVSRANDKEALEAFLGASDEARATTAFVSRDAVRSLGLPDVAGTTAASEIPPAVDIAHYANTRVSLRGKADNPAFVVLTDMHYPGWRARLNGREVPLVAINGLFRGVRVEPGNFEVEMEFAPVSFRLGATLSALALLLSAALWWWLTRRRQHQQARQAHTAAILATESAMAADTLVVADPPAPPAAESVVRMPTNTDAPDRMP